MLCRCFKDYVAVEMAALQHYPKSSRPNIGPYMGRDGTDDCTVYGRAGASVLVEFVGTLVTSVLLLVLVTSVLVTSVLAVVTSVLVVVTSVLLVLVETLVDELELADVLVGSEVALVDGAVGWKYSGVKTKLIVLVLVETLF